MAILHSGSWLPDLPMCDPYHRLEYLNSLLFGVPPAVADRGGDEVIASKTGEMKPNSGKIFRFGSRPGLLILESDGTYRALSATCTHLACTVQYRSDLREIWCACHNGIYDLNGRNVSGPPPRPLTLFDVHL